MADFRLEHQQNTAAQILIRAPQLNLYASKNQLPPAIARFRLLQVLSQSPKEADPAPVPFQTAGAHPAPGAQAVAADAERGGAQHQQPDHHQQQHQHQHQQQQQAQDANDEPPAADADVDSDSEDLERDDPDSDGDESLSELGGGDEEFFAPLIGNEAEGEEGLEQELQDAFDAALQEQQQQHQPAEAGGAAWGHLAHAAPAAAAAAPAAQAGQAQAAAGAAAGEGGGELLADGSDSDVGDEGDGGFLPDADDFAHSAAGAYPLYRGAYVYGYPYAPYGGSTPAAAAAKVASMSAPPGAAAAAAAALTGPAAVAAADATWLARRMHSASRSVARRAYATLMAVMVAIGATALASATDAAAGLAAAAPRTLRTVMWAVRASLSYKRFQASCYGTDTEKDEGYMEALSQLHTYWANKLLEVCRRNGGVYVKAGQFAAAFGGVPREYRTVLAQLEDRAVPRPYRAVRRALERELGGRARVAATFTSFDRRATAAASLAQVHHAVLADGREVAVKVQYPGLAGSVAADLSVMSFLARAAGALFPAIRLHWLYEELAAKLEVELDFRNEIRNSNRFREVLAAAGESGRVRVPQLHEQLCSSKVLVMEWIAGAKITDVEALTRQGINPRLVGRQLCKLFGELMFIQGYVHGDPHPGNLMVRPKGRPSWLRWLFRGTRRGFELVVLDHGTYLEVEPELRQQFCQLWCAVVMQDEATQADISTAMAGEAGGRILPLLLTQRARNRAEEAALRARLGIRGFGDMTALLSAVSRHLVDLLRVVTVIRSSSAALGVTMPERLLIYSQVAVKGLPPRRPNPNRPTYYLHKTFASAAYRAKLRAALLGLGLYAWGSSLLGRTWDALLSVFGEALFE
ncbi:hypothetical protein HXX76_004234 [Chlamydomonas incerta]|uniref:ABC1 atypical kinase-like domain-containing protein n=1 Tax=Chlamydomonas incerta TaxID=51695 RepID=A0A835TLX0_CHLIN|nr:hypothetical protein HXX76_004234 [Chlamydomonas incerta]|eukprot:KAG2440120.1 hypothetical protein HXX76_004234 [Chlamydomonas incerta]